MIEDEDEFYDSETEPSFIVEEVEEVDISNKLNDLSFTKSARKSIAPIHQQFYAVQLLNKNRSKTSTDSNLFYNRIFINKENAMKFCKQDPDNRRFKFFRNFQEAYAFSFEMSEIESGEAPSERQIQAILSNNGSKSPGPSRPNENVDKTPESKNTKSNLSQDAEKLPFSAPRKPEVNEMRSFIEKGDFESFKNKVISNPRFLITAGDAPVIYQEGFRYNALHVCAKENQTSICQLILNLLNNTSFLQKMYRNDSDEQTKSRSHRLLDLYLNTPEKGLNETPLHFATKFGAYEVARLLMSSDICCKYAQNKFGKTPNEIICSKATKEWSKDKADMIKNLFEQCFYVPLFRDDDKGDVMIDKPSPKLEPDQNNSDTLKSNLSSPSFNRTNCQARKLAGYVGPVSPNVANEIYERLKSPAKLRRSPLNLDILRSDDYKGYERILRKITDEMNIPWCEYWGFLDSYCNLKSNDGLEKLETYLKQKKIQNILDSQVSSVQVLLNDSLNNNNEMKSENKKENDLFVYLKQFLNIVDQLKTQLDLKEHLSSKFEKFVKKIQKSLPEDDEEFDYETINDTINRYMSVIIELSRLDKTSKCYFNLYKTSKILLDLLKCSKQFENFHMSPIFKKIINPAPLSTTRPLSNATNTSIWSMRNPSSARKNTQIRKPLFNDSDEEDDKSDKNLSDEDKSYDDADDSIIDHLKQNEESDELEMLTKKLSSNFINQVPKSRKSINPFGSRDLNDGDEEYKLNDLNGKSWLPRNSGVNKNYNLFMFGTTPSKLDRAVYLAIQDSRLDSTKYVLLNEWFDYMRNFKQSDMQKWKTPMRQNSLSMKSRGV